MKFSSLFLPLALANGDVCTDSPNAASKPGFCTDVTAFTYQTNSWVCRNCFNVRLNLKLDWIGVVGKWFDNKDFVWIAFKNPVSVIKWAGPADSVEADGQDEDGNYLYKVGFNDNFNPGDGRIDINMGECLQSY